MQIADNEQLIEIYKPRLFFVIIGVVLFFLIILLRVWHLQIYNGERWRLFSEANKIELKKIPAMRGRVLDRNGVILADNKAAYDLVFKTNVSSLEQNKKNIDFVSEILQWDQETKNKKAHMISASKNNKIVLQKNLNKNEISKILAKQFLYPNFAIEYTLDRFYPYNEMASHVLGYISEIDAKKLKKMKRNKDINYVMGDYIGIDGVEKFSESLLKGVNGVQPIIENARGIELGEDDTSDLLPAFKKQIPKSGKDVSLSIDSRLQKVFEDAFIHPAGSGVLMDVKTGDVLALVSKPNFAPQEFSRGVSQEYWQDIRKNFYNPMYNRAVKGLYPPGSTFKMVTAHAALAEKTVSFDDKVFCPGYYRIGREVKKCWKRGGHGWVNLQSALMHSCDVYFYDVGKKVGVDNIAKYAKKYGLGLSPDIQYLKASSGHVPTKQWKQDKYKQKWVGGETLSVAIGQGYLQVSPLQMAKMLAILVTGYNVEPNIFLNKDRQDIKQSSQQSERVISTEFQDIIMRGMFDAVNKKGGTAYWSVRSEKVLIAGKTGTAQVVSFKAKKQLKDHAWFVAYVPADNPQVAISVMVENGGHGGAVAGPIAKKVLQSYGDYYVEK